MQLNWDDLILVMFLILVLATNKDFMVKVTCGIVFSHCSCVNSDMQPILRSTMARQMSEGSFSLQFAHTHTHPP